MEIGQISSYVSNGMENFWSVVGTDDLNKFQIFKVESILLSTSKLRRYSVINMYHLLI